MTHPFTTIVRVLRDQPRTQNHVSIEILLNGCLGLFNCFLRSTYNQHINDSGQDSLKFSFELHYFGPNSRLAQTKTAIPIRSVQNADCRLGTKYRLGKKCRLQTGYKMQTENFTVFFVWYVITFHLTTYRASRNRFSAIIFYDYLHHCGIFLSRFLITDALNIISSLPRVFSLRTRVGWCDVCAEFTNLIKVDVVVVVNEMSPKKCKTDSVLTSGYVNAETILHLFYKITNERGTKTVFTYAHVKWFYGQSERAYYLNYFIISNI